MIRHLLPLAAILVAAPAFAGPIDGSWKADLASAKLPTRPDVSVLKNGVYDCNSCIPAYSVPADGAFHPISGHAYVDQVAITAVDARTIEQRNQLGGKLVSLYRTTVTPDGKALSTSWEDMTAPNGQVARGESSAIRIGAPVAGAHLASGSWRTTKIANISDQALTVSYTTMGNNVMFKTPDGFAYTAEIGGAPVTMTGTPASQTVAVKSAPSGLEEWSYDDGKLIDVRTMTVSPDGQTLKVIDQDKKRGTSTSWTMRKVG